MTSIPHGVTAIVTALAGGPPAHRLLLFDFDGTLAELAPSPDKVAFPGARRDALAALAARERVTVGIVSGRRLDDVRARVGLGPPLYFAGLHGLEIEGGGATFLHERLRRAAPLISDVRARAIDAISGLAGAVVEDKGYSFVLHTRQAAPPVKAAAIRAVVSASSPFEQRGEVRLQYGHEMCEVLPDVPWNKGDAVRWIQRRVSEHARGPVRTMYVGDDLTDEDAFRALPVDDVSVVVGSRPSAARHRLADPPAVEALVRMLAAMP